MSKDSLNVIYEQLVQARQIFVYFLLTMNIGMVAFIGNHLLNDQTSSISDAIQILLLITLLLHAISIGLGLYYQWQAQEAMEHNFNLLKSKQGGADITPSKDQKSVKTDNELECLQNWTILSLSGAVIVATITFMIIILIR